MKPLIRPFLFAVARLGLFQAVMAWIVGQWESILYVTPDYGVGLSHSGWAISVRYSGNAKSASQILYGRGIDAVLTDWMEYGNHSPALRFPGVGCWWTKVRWVGTLQHWFATSVFLAFNLFLHFTYRKRPEAEPCDD